jgi:mono/diheme cytochrome c family protein
MMTTPIRILALSLSAIFLLVVAGAKAADEGTANQKNAVINITAAAGDPDFVAKGKELYHRMPCVRCHGGNCVQNSTAAFDLRTFPHDDKARMPPWGDVLTTEEIDQLWAYVQSVHQ